MADVRIYQGVLSPSKRFSNWRMWRSDEQCEAASAQNLIHHAPMDISQPKIAALKSIGQASVVNAQLMQQSRVQVMDVNGVVHDVVENHRSARKPFRGEFHHRPATS